MVTKPYHQSHCNSCWAFVAVAAVESLAAISGYDDHVTQYSIQHVLDCNDNNLLTCKGGWMFLALRYMSKAGVLLKGDYDKYDATKKACSMPQEELDEKKHISDFAYVEKDARFNDEIKE